MLIYCDLQLQIHSNFFTSFKLLKFRHEVNIISINSFLSGSYLEHLKRKCILIINQINKVQWVDFKLENVLVSLHSLKTMGLGSIIFKEW